MPLLSASILNTNECPLSFTADEPFDYHGILVKPPNTLFCEVLTIVRVGPLLFILDRQECSPNPSLVPLYSSLAFMFGYI